MNVKERQAMLQQRIASEQNGLLNDIALWEAVLPDGTAVHHHIHQFGELCRWMLGRLEESFTSRPERWPNLDQSSFNSLIISVLSGKWILLRQIAQQRFPSSPYLKAAEDLDQFAENCYQRLRTVLENQCKVDGISASSPLVYLGPIARLFLFDEEAPCIISAPFGAANQQDGNGSELSRQTVPHEVGHAIFEQIPGLMEELSYKTGAKVMSGTSSQKKKLILSVILKWLDEILADMTGTALAGLPFAESAQQITIMPDKMVGVTDGEHPIPLLRTFIHGWVLGQTDPKAAIDFNGRLAKLTDAYINQPLQSLPAVITVTMGEVKEELLNVVDVMWNCDLETLDGKCLGDVLKAACSIPTPDQAGRALPTWGEFTQKGDNVIFRLVGPSGGMTSPLPGLPLYFDLVCCPMKLQYCCSHTVM